MGGMGDGENGRWGEWKNGRWGEWEEWEDWGDLEKKECILITYYLLLNQRWGNGEKLLINY